MGDIRDNEYHRWLREGRVYRFPNRRENHRPATVTARLSTFGGIWLLYESIANELDLRYWVMADGGISQAVADHESGRTLLVLLPAYAHVAEFEDITYGMDPGLRREIEEIMRRIDADDQAP